MKNLDFRKKKTQSLDVDCQVAQQHHISSVILHHTHSVT